MRDEGARHLAEYIPKYASLTHLHIGSNFIGLDGTRALVQVLPQCKTLLSLDMCDNNIGTEAESLVNTCMHMADNKGKLNGGDGESFGFIE